MRNVNFRWTVGRRLALGFGTVTAGFVTALGEELERIVGQFTLA